MNPIVLITGTSSGIGEACARMFAQNGYDIILNARRIERLQNLKDQLEKDYKINCLLLPFDVRKKEEVNASISAIPYDWQNISVLVNNAGLAAGLSRFYEGDSDDWDTMIDTTVNGLLYVTRAVVPLMISRNHGHIINIGSIAGKEIYDKGNIYCSTKHAVDALNRSMRLELSESGIRVTAVNPGAVETEFSIVRFHGDTERAKQVYKGFENLIANDIADAVYWAASRPSHVNINDIIIMPTAQPMAGFIHKKLD
ncbi:MAG: SDR family NAD(P)-dependent oxidoreductase [Bacteroidia bacterium]|nr:SDR family NAD(P)-dependent oxidoreductase [Bacteroidia bacterium]